MENLMQTLLPFGNITITVVSLLLLLLLLAGIYQLGILGVRLLLALDTEDAPKLEFKNYILTVLKGCEILQEAYKSKVFTYKGGWIVLKKEWDGSPNDYYTTNGLGNKDQPSDIKNSCTFSTEEEALILAKVKYPCTIKYSINYTRILKIGLFTIALDLILLLLQVAFFETVILGSLVTFVYAVRTLAQKVYKNTKRINTHEGKITKLEENK